jgi:hypothetical protein
MLISYRISCRLNFQPKSISSSMISVVDAYMSTQVSRWTKRSSAFPCDQPVKGDYLCTTRSRSACEAREYRTERINDLYHRLLSSLACAHCFCLVEESLADRPRDMLLELARLWIPCHRSLTEPGKELRGYNEHGTIGTYFIRDGDTVYSRRTVELEHKMEE